MPKSTKSRDRNTKNARPNGESKNRVGDRKGDAEVNLLSPEQWVRFGEAYRLSNRELEVLILISRDMPRKVIASELRISFDSVSKYCDRLRKKTKTTGRVALVRRLVEFERTMNPIGA